MFPDLFHSESALKLALPHQLFHGTTWHSRLLPSVHKFAYPYRYWGVNISALVAGQELPEVALLNNRLLDNKILKGLLLFSAEHKALQQFYADDYLQESDGHNHNYSHKGCKDNEVSDIEQIQTVNSQLLIRLKDKFIEKTGSAPTGDIIGLLVCRNAGLYFSPVNFYLGFDREQRPSHLLAEVSNTPWDKRHYYGFLLDGIDTDFCHDKNFHVSPFNPIDQLYSWQVKVEHQQGSEQNSLKVRIAIDISDVRGKVLKTGVQMTGIPMTAETIRRSLKQNPLMNMTSLTRIYWHAFKLYALKKVPYVGYDEKLADSKQSQDNLSK